MIAAIFIFGGILISSIIFTYLVLSLVISKSIHHDPTMDVVIQTNIALVSVSTADFLGDVLSILSGKVLLFLSNIPSQALNLLRFGMVLVFAIAFHEGYTYFLKGGDIFFRSLLGPIFQDVFFNFFQILRLIYGFLMPVLNYYYAFFGQLYSGTIAIAIKCQLSATVKILSYIVNTFISLFTTISDFAGDGSVDKNPIVSEFNVTDIIVNSQIIVTSQESVASCICDGLTPIFELGFALLKTPHMPRAINYALNFFVSIVQEIIQIIPPFKKFPTFTRSCYYLGSSIFESGKYADLVIISIVELFFRNFVPKFQLRGVPKQFVFASLARFSVAAVEFVHVVYRTYIHLLIPMKQYLLNPQYMYEAMDMSKVFMNIELGIYGILNVVHWIMLLTTKSVLGGLDNLENNKDNYVLEGIPPHVQMDCYEITEMAHINLPCSIYHFTQAPLNLVLLLYNLIREFLWFSVATQQRDVGLMLQRYDGMFMERSVPYSCEFRRDYMKWDKTLGDCMCDKPTENFALNISVTNPLNLNKEYDQYCGQISMQANVYRPITLGLDQLGKVLLAEIVVSVITVFVNFVIESFRTTIRFYLSLPGIAWGYPTLPINCGWGTGDIQSCWHKRFENEDYCEVENGPGCTCNPMLPLAYNSSCDCIFLFPDTEQEVLQRGLDNKLLTALYSPEAQGHWCGSFQFENFFRQTDEIAYAIDDLASILSDSFQTENDYCGEMTYEITSTDTLKYTAEEWNQALINETYKEDSCSIYGNVDMICALSMTLQRSVFTVVQQVRLIIMGLFTILSGRATNENIKLDISERICDIERVIASGSSAVAVLPTFIEGLLGTNYKMRKWLTGVFFSILRIITVPLQGANVILVFLSDIMRNPSSVTSKASIDLVDNLIKLTLDWFALFFRSIGGGFFRTLADIVDTIGELLSTVVWDFLVLNVKVIIGMVELITKGELANDFYDNLWQLLKGTLDVILKLSTKLWELVKKLLKPIFDFLDPVIDIVDTVCDFIADTVCSLAGCSFQCNLRSGPKTHLFSSRPDTPLFIAEHMGWDGTSRCDLMVHMYKNYTWNQLRPLEQIEIMDCLDQRHIARKLANLTELPIPADIIYNWKRKYIMTYDVGVALMIYVEHLTGKLTASEMMRKMRDQHVNLALYVPAFQKAKHLMKNTFTISNADYLIREIFHSTDDIKDNTSDVAAMYRIYNNFGKFTTKIHPHLKKLGPSFTTMLDHIETPILGNQFHNLKSRYTNVTKIFKREISNYSYPILGAAGVDADISPCTEREDSYVCLQCTVLDNILNTLIREGDRVFDYWQNVYARVTIPSYIDYMEVQSKQVRAYRDKLAPKLDEFYEAPVTNASAGQLSPVRLAAKDWEYLVTNFAIRNDRNIIDIVAQFLNTVDETYVPFFAHGIGYIISYPFIEGCPMELIHCQLSNTQERIALISQQWLYQLIFWAGLYGFQVYSGTPIFNMLSVFPVNLLFTVFIYLYFVYGMVFTCMPSLPNCLVDDFFVWLHDVAYPQCFCEYYPGLAESCNPETCFLSDRSITYTSCDTAVPLSSFDNLGYFWSIIFWFRKEFPVVFLWMFKTPPFSYLMKSFEGVKDIAYRLDDNVPIRQEEHDCLSLRYSDVIVIGIGFYVVSFALSALVPVIVKTFVHGIKISVIFLNTLFVFGVVTDLSTTELLKED